MRWYLEVIRKYAVFSGRARRAEDWMFTLINCIIMVVLKLAAPSGESFGTLQGLYALATLLPALAVSVRRLHDTGRSGWWLLLVFVPIIGPLVLLVFSILEGESGSNQYGPNPKAVSI
jgi:uncharacterized membrane protein YhaH (DUF805 family)